MSRISLGSKTPSVATTVAEQDPFYVVPPPPPPPKVTSSRTWKSSLHGPAPGNSDDEHDPFYETKGKGSSSSNKGRRVAGLQGALAGGDDEGEERGVHGGHQVVRSSMTVVVAGGRQSYQSTYGEMAPMKRVGGGAEGGARRKVAGYY